MKSLITLLFILVASTTYRCGKEEETINCADATAQMLGSYSGKLVYSGPEPPFVSDPFTGIPLGNSTGDSHDFTMEVTSTSNTDCTFIGTLTYGEVSNNTSYQIVGTIDKYGWVQFIETKFEKSGNIKENCIDQYPVNTWGWAPLARSCNYWPTGRWIEGGIFKEGRFSNDPFEWEGKFELPESSYFTPAPGADPTTALDWTQVDFVTGDYQLTKQ